MNPMGYLPGYQHPFDAEVWTQVKMPTFSGLPEHYAKFEKDWEQVERTARAMVPHPLNELSLLLRFKGCVDEATQRRLMVFMDPQTNPYPTLAKFRGELRKEFGVDPDRQYRQDLKGVTLKKTGPAGREVTYTDWRNFETEYHLRRQDVPGLSTKEEQEIIVTQLPPAFHKQVAKEEDKQRRKRPYARMTFSHPDQRAELVVEVERSLGEKLPAYESCEGGYLFKCKTEEARTKLLGYDGWTFGDVQIKVEPYTHDMSADDILKFVGHLLRIEQKVSADRETLGMDKGSKKKADPVSQTPQPAKQQTNAVVIREPPKQAPRAGKGKGGGNAPAQGQNSSNKGWQPPKGGKAGQAKGGWRSPPRDQGYGNQWGWNGANTQWYDDSRECRTCRNAGREYVHDYRRCKFFQEGQAARYGRALPQRIEGPQPAAPTANPEVAPAASSSRPQETQQ